MTTSTKMLHSAIDKIDFALDNFFGATNLAISKPELSKPSLVTYSVDSWTYFLRFNSSVLPWLLILVLVSILLIGYLGLRILGLLKATRDKYTDTQQTHNSSQQRKIRNNASGIKSK